MQVISRNNLPVRLPIIQTVVGYLLLDKLKVSQTVWLIAYILTFLLWVGILILLMREDRIDIFNEEAEKE